MNSIFKKFVEDACNSPYEASRVCELLERLTILEMRTFAAQDAAVVEECVRRQGLVDEVWIMTHVLRVHEAAKAEVSRLKLRRIPGSPLRGKTSMETMGVEHGEGDMDTMEEEVKRMRLQ